MFNRNNSLVFVRIALVTMLLAGYMGSTPAAVQAKVIGETRTESSTKIECQPNEGWMWTPGPFEPEVAAQAQEKLSQQGIEASVDARSYGETDSCGTYSQRGIDFTVTLSKASSNRPSSQQELSDTIHRTLTDLGKPGLGNVKLVTADGNVIPLQRTDELLPVASSGAELLPGEAITRNVYVIVYDPLLANGQKLSQYLGWNSHATITQQTVNFFSQATNNRMNYVVTSTTVVTDGWPELADGFRYTEQEYLAVLAGQQPHHEPTGVSYNKIVNSPQFDICGKVNRGEIDEVWIYNGPWFGFYESTLAGPGAYWFNSSPVSGTHNCNKLVPIMGPSPERTVDEAVHNFTHRSESTMSRAYGSWQQNNTSHNWNKFALVKAQSPSYSYSGCGSSHFPANGTSDYNYNNPASVLSNCHDFLNYPALSDPLVVSQPVTCSTWGCSQLGYFNYWFGHFPSFAGCGPDGRANDWWKYLASPAYALYPSNACQANMRLISGNVGAAGALLSYTDGTARTVTADASGNYFLMVSDHWSGTVTPSKTGYAFTPVSKSYTDVTADANVQNYTAEGNGPAYYVNSATGNNSNSCASAAAPCRNIQEAINKASPGNTVYVTSGTYSFSSNPTPNVVIIDKDLTLSGGWNAEFTSRTGVSTIDGGNINNGILAISGTVMVDNFIVQNSTSWNSGAIYIVNGNFTLKKSTLRNNVATSNGAGIFLDGGSLSVINSTISGNRANGSGGGIHASINSNASVIIQNSTIAYNQASTGGGISRTNGTYTVTNTIVANNSASTSGPDCSGTIAQANFNIIENMTGCSITNGSNNLNLDPNIEATLTGVMLMHVPLAGSPAIDAGTNSGCPSIDQRGVTRPQGGSCDIGAYEYQPVTRHVKWNATGANDGTSWTNAYMDLQTALAAASSGDDIWVAAGTYLPTTGTDRSVSFKLKNSVAIHGGFAGTETTLTQRDPATNVTILSGDIGIPGNMADNSGHVLKSENVGSTSVLDGFTITGGSASDSYDGNGGGMYNINSNPTLQNLVFSNNTAGSGSAMFNSSSSPTLYNVMFNSNVGTPTSRGGAMVNDLQSNPTLTNVTFVNNSVVYLGGAMTNTYNSNPSLVNVTFEGNSASDRGGAIYNWQSNPTLKNVTFNGNSAAIGGAIFNDSNSNPTLQDLVFSKNTAESGSAMFNYTSSPTLYNVTFDANVSSSRGGAMVNDTNSSPHLVNVTFVNNTVTYWGGAMFNTDNSNPILENVTFTGNSSTDRGGAIYNWASHPLLKNVTLSGNSATTAGAIYNDSNSNPSIVNSIFYGDIGGEIYNNSGMAAVTYSIIQGGYPGLSNLDANPLLGSLQNNGGFTQTMALGFGSPAIDAGDDANCPATDQRGMTRPQGSHCDIGAYEYDGTTTPPTPIHTSTPINTPTHTPTFTPTFTPTVTRTPTNTPTVTPTSPPSLLNPYVNIPLKDAAAVGMGDFNSDGLRDVAVTNSIGGTSQLFIFLQLSNGSLSTPTTYEAGYQPESLAVGDLNHDGRSDIVVTNMSSYTISVFLQQPNGSMASRVTYSTVSAKLAVAVGDVNNDGLDDVAVSGNELGILTQNANGTLNPIVHYPAPGSPTSINDIAIADVNNDGKNDVIKKHGYPTFVVYLQKENGTLASGISYPGDTCTPVCSPYALDTDDVTGDGLTDVVVTFGGNRPNSKIAVFAQGQNGSLQSPVIQDAYDIPEPVEIADVNQDNREDVLVVHGGWNRVGLFLQQANGTLSPYSLFPIPYASHYETSGMAVGDINNDGLPDVAIGDYNYGLVILYHGSSSIPNPPTPTRVPTYTPTFTPTFTATNTPTRTPTSTVTSTFTPTPPIFALILQPDAATGVDTYIYSGSKNTNYGAAVTIGVGEDNNTNNRIARSLLKFDLSSIPANATITSATLSLWTSADLSSNDRTIEVYRLKVPFNESEATWNVSAKGINWQGPGASGLNDRETTAIGFTTILNNEPLNLEKTIALSPALIQEMVNGSFMNQGFVIVVRTELNDRFNYVSSDSTTSGQWPRLEIHYTVSAVTPDTTPVATSTSVPANTSTQTPLPTRTPAPTRTPRK